MMPSTPYIDIHTHHRSATVRESIATFLVGDSEACPEGQYAAGIHPWQVERIDDGQQYRKALLDALTSRCVAIGEIGLDYAITDDPAVRATQMEWFRWQMEIAVQKRLPVIIHCVRAYNDLIPVLTPYDTTAVIHGFTGSAELASQLLRAGCYLSFGQRSLHSEKARETLKNTPTDRLFLETDESPVPIEELYQAAASLTGLPLEALKQAVYRNYRNLFNTNLTL